MGDYLLLIKYFCFAGDGVQIGLVLFPTKNQQVHYIKPAPYRTLSSLFYCGNQQIRSRGHLLLQPNVGLNPGSGKHFLFLMYKLGETSKFTS